MAIHRRPDDYRKRLEVASSEPENQVEENGSKLAGLERKGVSFEIIAPREQQHEKFQDRLRAETPEAQSLRNEQMQIIRKEVPKFLLNNKELASSSEYRLVTEEGSVVFLDLSPWTAKMDRAVREATKDGMGTVDMNDLIGDVFGKIDTGARWVDA